MNLRERAITIVSQNHWRPVFRAEHDIEIAVAIDVGSPGAGETSIQDRRRQFCLRGDVGEFVCAFLLEQTKAARSRQDQISFEIVIEIEPDNAFLSAERALARPERDNSHCQYALLFVSQYNDREPSPLSEIDRSNPFGGLHIWHWLRRKLIALSLAPVQDWRLHLQQVSEWLRSSPGGGLMIDDLFDSRGRANTAQGTLPGVAAPEV
jgi:hypothetical protein